LRPKKIMRQHCDGSRPWEALDYVLLAARNG